MVRKLIALCLIVIAAELGINYFIKNTQFNKNSYKFADFNVSVDQTGKQIKTQITSNKAKIVFDAPIAYAQVKTTGDKTTIDNSDTELNYEVKKSGPTRGLKETIVLKNLKSPSEYTFNLDLTNVNRYEKDPKTGVWHFYDFQNKEIFYIPKGFMEDANGFYSDKVDIQVERRTDGGHRIKIKADKNWLTDPSRAYPVKIDPSVLIPGPKLSITVTNIGRFHWEAAVEYEIKDESGKVLGSDVVTIAVKPDETNQELSSFLQDYLQVRLATWILAQGNYSLREMSNDRLTSKNFKAEDSGDDAEDHKEERSARKQLIDSFNPVSYPKISMDLSEADAIQNPVVEQRDKNGQLTGKRINSVQPTFQIKNEAIGAGSEILRPDGPGDATSITFGTPFAHWKDVADLYPDVNSYVTQYIAGTGIDYYSLANTVLSSQTINSIDIVTSAYSPDCSPDLNFGVRLSSTDSYGPSHSDCGYFTRITDSAISRPGGGSWAVADLNSLQGAIKLTSVSVGGCCNFDTCNNCTNPCSVDSSTLVSQYYVVVNYSGATTQGANINGGVNIRGGTKIIH